MNSDLENGTNTHELIPNGASIRVTNDNKAEFIRKKCHYLSYLVVSD